MTVIYNIVFYYCCVFAADEFPAEKNGETMSTVQEERAGISGGKNKWFHALKP